MADDELDQLNIPDFSKLAENLYQIQEIVKPIIEATIRFQETICPLVQTISEFKHKFDEAAEVLADVFKPLAVIGILGDAQFVYWEDVNANFMDSILLAENVDDELRAFLAKNKYKSVERTIGLIETDPVMKNHLRLFSQSVEAYERGSYNLALTGLTSVSDGLLSYVSKNSASRFKNRIEAIKSKFEKEEILVSDDFSIMALALTLDKTLTSFSEFASFDKPEPKLLNRHWIAHGRSNKKRTKLDCIKLINMIYGLLLVNKIG